jgi:hypothetical protein
VLSGCIEQDKPSLDQSRTKSCILSFILWVKMPAPDNLLTGFYTKTLSDSISGVIPWTISWSTVAWVSGSPDPRSVIVFLLLMLSRSAAKGMEGQGRVCGGWSKGKVCHRYETPGLNQADGHPDLDWTSSHADPHTCTHSHADRILSHI